MRILAFSLIFLAILGCNKNRPLIAHGKPVQHWIEALQNPDVNARKKAVEILSNVGTADPAVIPALTAALKDREAGVRSAAVLALLRLGPAAREAIPALKEAQRDRDPNVRNQAVKALEKIQSER
jgi:HEAT repeat protein